MWSTDKIADQKKDMDDSGFALDLSMHDVPMCSEAVNLLDLSDDVLLYILRLCPPRDLKALGYSCSRLASLVRERSLWRRVDARAECCSRARLKWLLDSALHADTHVLMLAGFAREADGCMGFINVTRKEAEHERPAHRHKEQAGCGRTTICETLHEMPMPQNRDRMERHPARFFISAQRTPLNAHRCFPSWPDDSALEGPQRCKGPQFTLSQPLLQQLSAKCPHLKIMALEYCNIDCSNTSLGHFPKTLKKLSLRGTKCFNMTFDKSFLFKVQDYLPVLESLDVSECEWMDPATLLPLSKLTALEELIMQDCYKLTEFVAYASLTARYGFRTLKRLDLRGSPVGDSEVSALGWLPQLEKLWLSARRSKCSRLHAHYSDDERTQHKQLYDWEMSESDDVNEKSDPDVIMEDTERGTGNAMPSSEVTNADPSSTKERSPSKDLKETKDNKDETDKRDVKRKPDNKGDDTDGSGSPPCKRRRTGVKISFENNTITKKILPVIRNGNGFFVFDESAEENQNDSDSNENNENQGNNNENNDNPNNEQRDDGNNLMPPNFEFNLINPMGSIDVGNVEIDFSVVNVDNLRESMQNVNHEDIFMNPRQNDNVNRNFRYRYHSNDNRDGGGNGEDRENGENEPNRANVVNEPNRANRENETNRANGENEPNRAYEPNRGNANGNNQRDGPAECIVDCIKIDQLIDVSEVGGGRQNEVIVIASSARPKSEPSTSKQPDNKPETHPPNNAKANLKANNVDNQNVNDEKVADENKTDAVKKIDDENQIDNKIDDNKIDNKIDDNKIDNKIDDNKIYDNNIGDNKTDDPKPGPSGKNQVNDGASTSKDGENKEKEKYVLFRKNKDPVYVNCAPENPQRRDPLPPVQYHIEPRHHVLYVGVGPQLNTYRFPRDSAELLRHLHYRPAHVISSVLVTDFAMRRFGRADGEDVNIIHVGPDGPMIVGPAAGSRPDRSSLRFLSVTGYRHITDRSLVHLATAAPDLAFVDFSGTSVTENGVENFKSIRPDCDVVFSQFVDKEEENN